LENKEVYQLLAENMQDIVSQHSIDGRILWISPSVTALLGYSVEELIDTSFYDLLQEDDREYMVNYAHDLTLSNSYNENIRIEYRIRKKDGDIAWYESLTKPILNSKGEIDKLQVTSRDVSKRRKTENALKNSMERLELAVAGADLGLWDLNLQSGELVFNDRWTEMLGYDFDDIEPTFGTWAGLLHPDDRSGVNRLLNAHLNDETDVYESEHRLKMKSGKYLWVLSRGRVLEWDDDGKPLRAVGTHLDIDNNKKVEAAVMKAIVETQEQERTRFSRDLHDGIGQYLVAIRMHLELLNENIANVAPPEQSVPIIALLHEHIDNTIVHLRDVVYDLMPGTLKDLGLVPAIEELYKKVLNETELEFDFNDESIQSKANHRLPDNIEVNVYRIVQQLLSNTLQHACAKRISLHLQQRDDQVRLLYSDDGIGMEDANNVLNQGSGVRNIQTRIKSLHGSIRFQDNAKGLKVLIIIPLEE